MALANETRVGKGRITYVPQIALTGYPAANEVNAAQDVAVPDTDVGDVVSVSVEYLEQALAGVVSAYVSAQNVVTIVVVAGAAGDADFGNGATYANLTIFHRN